MHFPIIVLEALDAKTEDYTSDVWSEYDTTLLHWTDYTGDVYNEEDRKRVLNSDWLIEAFKGFVTIDKRNETISFLNNQADLREAFQDLQMQLACELANKAENKELSDCELRFPTRSVRDCYAMFYISSSEYNYTLTLYDLLAESPYLAGKTFKFGNIIDAHW